MTTPLGAGPLAGVDCETTDKDPEQARLLQICVALLIPGRDPDVRTTLVDPGEDVEIPAEATAINGLTLDRVRSEGKPVVEVLDVWLGDLADAVKAGGVLVAQNACYDLTVLDREARRNRVPSLHDRLGDMPLVVADPMVLDKRCIKYRRRVSPEQGARCLKTLAQVYGLGWDDSRAHDAEYDTLMACRVVWKIGQLSRMPHGQLSALCLDLTDPGRRLHRNDVAAFLSLADLTVAELHAKQALWYRQQTENFGQWLSEQRNEWVAKAEAAVADEDRVTAEQEAAELTARIESMTTDWPLLPYRTAVTQ